MVLAGVALVSYLSSLILTFLICIVLTKMIVLLKFQCYCRDKMTINMSFEIKATCDTNHYINAWYLDY